MAVQLANVRAVASAAPDPVVTTQTVATASRTAFDACFKLGSPVGVWLSQPFSGSDPRLVRRTPGSTAGPDNPGCPLRAPPGWLWPLDARRCEDRALRTREPHDGSCHGRAG